MRKVLDKPDVLHCSREGKGAGTKVSIQRQVPRPPLQCPKATATCLQDALEEVGKDECNGSGFNAGGANKALRKGWEEMQTWSVLI